MFLGEPWCRGWVLTPQNGAKSSCNSIHLPNNFFRSVIGIGFGTQPPLGCDVSWRAVVPRLGFNSAERREVIVQFDSFTKQLLPICNWYWVWNTAAPRLRCFLASRGAAAGF